MLLHVPKESEPAPEVQPVIGALRRFVPEIAGTDCSMSRCPHNPEVSSSELLPLPIRRRVRTLPITGRRYSPGSSSVGAPLAGSDPEARHRLLQIGTKQHHWPVCELRRGAPRDGRHLSQGGTQLPHDHHRYAGNQGEAQRNFPT